MVTMYNRAVLNTLPNAQKSNARFEAVLIEYDIEGKTEKAAWTFLIHPQSLKFNDAAKYNEISPLASSVANLQYEHSTGATLSISDLLMDTWCLGKSLRPVIDGVRALLKAKTDQGKFSPMVLAFRWGSFRFSPCVLTDIDWEVTRVLSGEPARVKMSITLKEIPKPLTRAEKDAKEKQKQALVADRRVAEGKPKLPLTQRQAEDASKAAKDYLISNKSNFSADVQAAIASNKYKLSTDRDSGNVSMLVDDKVIGIVLRSLGSSVIANSKITTIPTKENVKLPELK